MKDTKKKIQKGEFGYIKNQQKRRVIYTILAFAPPLIMFLTGLAIYGERKNVFTVFAAVACLPACKFAVEHDYDAYAKAYERRRLSGN